MSTSTSRPSSSTPSWASAAQGAPTLRAASASSSIGVDPGSVHRSAAPSHGAGSVLGVDSTSSTAPSVPTSTTTMRAGPSTSDAAAARTAMSTRSSRSPASTARSLRSAATAPGGGSGTRLRGCDDRRRNRRRAPTRASTPADSRAASPMPIGDGDDPRAVVAPSGASAGAGATGAGVVVVVVVEAATSGGLAGGATGATTVDSATGGGAGGSAAGSSGGAGSGAGRSDDGRQVQALAGVDEVGVLDHVVVVDDDPVHVVGDRDVTVIDAGGRQAISRQVPQRVAGGDDDADRSVNRLRIGDGRRDGRLGGRRRQRQPPPGADHARAGQPATVRLREIPVELEDLAPPGAVAEVRAGQAEQGVAVGDRDHVCGRDRRDRSRCNHRGGRCGHGRRHRSRGQDRCVVGVGRGPAWAEREQHEHGGDEPLGQQAGARAGRWRDQLHPGHRGRRQLPQLGELGVDLDHDGHDEPGPHQPHEGRQDPDHDGRLVAHRQSRRPGPRVADDEHQQERDADDDGDHRHQGRERVDATAHGTSPARFTPRWAVALDDDDTVRVPGRIR